MVGGGLQVDPRAQTPTPAWDVASVPAGRPGEPWEGGATRWGREPAPGWGPVGPGPFSGDASRALSSRCAGAQSGGPGGPGEHGAPLPAGAAERAAAGDAGPRLHPAGPGGDPVQRWPPGLLTHGPCLPAPHLAGEAACRAARGPGLSWDHVHPCSPVPPAPGSGDSRGLPPLQDSVQCLCETTPKASPPHCLWASRAFCAPLHIAAFLPPV